MEDNSKLKEKIKFKISISEIEKESDIVKNKQKIFINRKIGLVACACLVLTTGIVFAKDIENYFRSVFPNSTEAIDMAVENGYIQKEEMDFVYDKDIGVKVDSMVLDEFNLAVSFVYEIKKDNVKSIFINDFNIVNNTGKKIYETETKYAEKIEDVQLAYTWDHFKQPVRVTDTTFSDSMVFGLREAKEEFNELYFKIDSMKIIYEDDSMEIIDGNWEFNVEISEEMRQSSTYKYSMVGENEYVKSCTGTLSNTGMIVEVELSIDFKFEEFMDQCIEENIEFDNVFALKSKSGEYLPEFIEVSDNGFIIHYSNINKFMDDIDTLELNLNYFDTTINIAKENIIK